MNAAVSQHLAELKHLGRDKAGNKEEQKDHSDSAGFPKHSRHR
jgi:hypothetical protein